MFSKMIATWILALLGLLANGSPIEHNEMEIWQLGLDNPDLVEGDMFIPHRMGLGNAIADEDYRWPGYPGSATIPYTIENSLANIKEKILSAMQQYHDNTCVRFVPRTDETEYIRMFAGYGCYALLGRNKTFPQPQPLSLGRGCDPLGTIIHELGHVLGFYHEQNRSDRDQYLNVYLQNVRPGHERNFRKLKPDQNILFNGFDYDSIMIYGNYAFSKFPNRLKTMEAKNGQELFEPYTKNSLTASDILRVNKMYKCPGYEN